jgi:hypothetical protein
MKYVFAAALVSVGISQPANHQVNCAPPERRMAAIRHARMINTAEASKRVKDYQPLTQLAIQPLSDGYTVQLTTDGASYSFSIKDTTDACHGVVFSDQDGVIYTGAPLQ